VSRRVIRCVGATTGTAVAEASSTTAVDSTDLEVEEDEVSLLDAGSEELAAEVEVSETGTSEEDEDVASLAEDVGAADEDATDEDAADSTELEASLVVDAAEETSLVDDGSTVAADDTADSVALAAGRMVVELDSARGAEERVVLARPVEFWEPISSHPVTGPGQVLE